MIDYSNGGTVYDLVHDEMRMDRSIDEPCRERERPSFEDTLTDAELRELLQRYRRTGR